MSVSKVGIYVDSISLSSNGGFGIRYDILRQYACRKDESIGRANVYIAVDQERMEVDDNYASRIKRFTEGLRDFQFKVIERPFSYSLDKESNQRIGKTTVDVEMAIDIVEESKNFDKILLLTNNLGYKSVIKIAQKNGCRVELMGFDNIPNELRKEADMNMSGYLIPNLLPISSENIWGEIGNRVRAICYDYNHNEGYGFMRYIKKINDYMWVADSREAESPFQTVFAHISQFEKDFNTEFIPSRELIFEFRLGQNEKGFIAENIRLVSAP